MKNLVRVLAGVATGVLGGLFFAQKSGDQLRQDVKNADNPLETLWSEVLGVGQNARDTLMRSVQNPENIKAVFGQMSTELEALTSKAKTLGNSSITQAREELVKLSQRAQAAANDLAQNQGSDLLAKGKDLLDKAETKLDQASDKLEKTVENKTNLDV